MARRKKTTYKAPKISTNIYDVAVLTALAIMITTIGFIAADGFATSQNLIGSAYFGRQMVCVSNSYGEIGCSISYIEAKPDTALIAGCFVQGKCTFTCKELEADCDDKNTACALKGKFC